MKEKYCQIKKTSKLSGSEKSNRRKKCRYLLLSAIPALAQALLVSEDFSYPLLKAGDPLVGADGGRGWKGAWQGNAGILFNRDTNLAYSFPVPGSRRGESQDSGSLYSQTPNYRAVYRNLAAPVSGEIWFSCLFRTGGTGSGGLVFNATAANASGGSLPTAWSILLDSSDANDRRLNVTVNGVTSLVQSGIPMGKNIFILGRMVTGRDGAFDLWVNPELGGITGLDEFTAAPDFSDRKAANPDAVFSLGIAAFRGAGGSSIFRLDALRLSDGEGNADAAFAETGGFFLSPDGTESYLTLREEFSPFQSNRRGLSTSVCRLPDGRLITLVDNGIVFSSDEMASWSAPLPILGAQHAHSGSRPGGGGGSLQILSSGRLVVAWRDSRKPDRLVDYWDLTRNGPVEGASGDIWMTLSNDTGLSWSAPQKVLSEPGGYPPKQILETSAGTLVMPVQYHRREPGRNVIVAAWSADQGESWNISPGLIDVGGQGHHDGALEPTLVELKDGRVWLVFRTTLGELWQSFSADGGRTWDPPSSTGISSSSSPPYLGRLKNGNLLLLWNRIQPSDGPAYPLRGGDGYFSEKVTSWHRQELSLAVSADEGSTWSAPLIIARHSKRGGRISYPYFFETEDGRVLIFASQGKLEAQIGIEALPVPDKTTFFERTEERRF